MALTTCSECGRAVSDKAQACIGCGAPLASDSPINLVPKRSTAPAPSRGQIKQRALWSLAIFMTGVAWAAFLEHRPGSRLPLFAATLLIIGGLCSLIVALIHAVSARR